MNDKTIYIAGKITGNDSFIDDFKKAERELKKLGYTKIINPCCLSKLNLDYEQFMTITLSMVDVADELYMLKNWEDSKGARREYLYAVSKDKVIVYER